MRMSRVLLAGVAVAGVAATTSAFTASNSTSGVTAEEKYAGYGEVTVTGVTVTDIQYNPSATDRSRLASVVFTATEDVSGQEAFLTLSTVSNGTTSGVSSFTCDTPTFSTVTTITCTTSTTPLFESFNTVGLTVAHAPNA